MGFEVVFDGIQDNATFELAAGIERGTNEGHVVKVSGNKTVSLCSAENKFSGVLITIEPGNSYGVMREAGYAKVAYSGTAPSAGEAVELVADGNGGVKSPATPGDGKLYRVVDVDTANGLLTLRLG